MVALCYFIIARFHRLPTAGVGVSSSVPPQSEKGHVPEKGQGFEGGLGRANPRDSATQKMGFTSSVPNLLESSCPESSVPNLPNLQA
jgi:hypothetical protein